MDLGLNKVVLKGSIRNITSSHTIQNTPYSKAELIVPRLNGREDIINLVFKDYTCIYREDQNIELLGNIRSHSTSLPSGKNRVVLYVNTDFELPNQEEEVFNSVLLDGVICKINDYVELPNGKKNIHFIIANKFFSAYSQHKINSYIPTVAWNAIAEKLKDIKVGDQVCFKGELHSREYKKYLEDGEFELRVAHEFVVTEIIEIDKK